MLYGPGTNGGEIVIMLESQAEYAVRAMKRMIRERVTAIEVKPSFEARWYRWLQSRMAGTSWTMSNNYFTAPNGKIVTQWPYGNMQYRVLTKLLGRVSESHSPAAVGDTGAASPPCCAGSCFVTAALAARAS